MELPLLLMEQLVQIMPASNTDKAEVDLIEFAFDVLYRQNQARGGSSLISLYCRSQLIISGPCACK